MDEIQDSLMLQAGAVGLSLCLYFIADMLKTRQRRRFKVRPINRTRGVRGNFQYYKKMKTLDAQQFFKLSRMTVPFFNELLTKISPKISRQPRLDGICAEERLLVTLQYLSQGTNMQQLAWTFHMGLTTVHKIIHETCQVLWDVLSPDYLKTPSSKEDWLKISKEFENKWNFPHCLGALDGKHINIICPKNSGSLFFNYKKTFSIVLLAACDANYLFTLIDIGAYGSQSDGGIFRNSIFGHRFEDKNMNIPHSNNLENTTIEMPYFFVADEAFPLKEYIMRPFPGRNLEQKQKIFNYRLSRARQVIENTFGILVSRWRVLKTTINCKVENVDNIVKAVVVLHNYCKMKMAGQGENNMYCPVGYVDDSDEANGAWRHELEMEDMERMEPNITRRAIYTIRDTLTNYFISDAGKVSWQETTVNRGRQIT